MLFVFYTTCSRDEICCSITSENIDTVILSQPLPFRSHVRSSTIFQFFLVKSKIQRICVHFQLFELVYITESGEVVVVQLQHSHFCVLKNEEADNELVLCVQPVLWRVQLHTMNCSHVLAF